MNKLFLTLILTLLGTVFTSHIFSQEQEKPKTPQETAIAEALRLETLLELEAHQAFYVDSILQHDFVLMSKEMDELQKARVQERSVYKELQEKWLKQIEAGYKKIFTTEQWTEYLKSTGQYKKEKKAKKSRKARKAEKAKKKKS